ncbi:MAG: 1-deoxy-D-xylulose-5-phosphate reductoisomerase [Lachnospiraceae bacterium]|nr:1-deoxy-D-xylulose-5-phosphate reductoisomerase [Lachnospiraceae bacterium]
MEQEIYGRESSQRKAGEPVKGTCKRIALLGSTGSIGTQTLDIVRNHPERLQVFALTAGSNVDLLEAQVLEFHPKFACLATAEAAYELESRLSSSDRQMRGEVWTAEELDAGENLCRCRTETEVLYGMEGLVAIAASADYDMLVTAVVGMMGIRPTLAAIRAGKDVALANKETLVTAGHLVMSAAREKGVSIFPIDSEHSAIFQCLHGENRSEVERIILTASGGPFRGKTRAEMENMTVEDALKHPNWSMGQKITIDSATMVNKGLEVMEAGWLFDVGLDQIDVVIQPQSLIHSMVEFRDGAIKAQLGTPDMHIPIQYALLYPERPALGGARVDFKKIRQITFEEPDPVNFHGFALALEAARAGGTMPTVFNAANEYAVQLFLQRHIRFGDITDYIGEAMAGHRVIPNPDVPQILDAEQEAYECIRRKHPGVEANSRVPGGHSGK